MDGLEKGTKEPAAELEDVDRALECVEIQLEAQRIENAEKEESSFLDKQRTLPRIEEEGGAFKSCNE